MSSDMAIFYDTSGEVRVDIPQPIITRIGLNNPSRYHFNDPLSYKVGEMADVTLTDPKRGDILRYDGDGNWVNYRPSEWFPVLIDESGYVEIDVSLTDKFLLVVDSNCTILPPVNPVDGAPFILRILMDGIHSVSFDSDWLGETPPVSLSPGDETVVGGIVLESDPVRAICNLVKVIEGATP